MPEPTPDSVEKLAGIIRHAEPRLTDVRRERGAQELVACLKREAAAREPSPAKTRRRFPWPTLGFGAAAAMLLVVLASRHAPAPPPVHAPSQHGPAQMLAHPAAPVREPNPLALLRPMDESGDGLGHDRLRSRPGTEVHAWLADCGQVVLRGDAELVVEENAADAIALRLKRGTVLISFEHESGRGLTVRTPDAVVRVTGTVFAVTAAKGPSIISVSRGSVEVVAGGLPVSVTAGKRWEVGATRLGTPETTIALALRALDKDGPTPARRPAKGRPVAALATEVSPTPPMPPPTEDARDEVSPSPGHARESDAEGIYRAAEKKLADGEPVVAKALLEKLVTECPRDPLFAPASYELGRLAFAVRDYPRARQRLQAVQDSADPAARAFRDPSAFLLCRCDLEAGQRAAAADCLERFRATFPDSPHAGGALALLATMHVDAKDCARATRLVQEYLRRFPSGPHARKLQEAAKDCR